MSLLAHAGGGWDELIAFLVVPALYGIWRLIVRRREARASEDALDDPDATTEAPDAP